MEILQYVSKNRLATKMLRVHLFSFFPIKTPRSLAALMPFGFLILWKKLTNVLTPFINSNFSDWVFHNFFKINEWVHKYAIYLVITMPTFTKVLCNVQHLVKCPTSCVMSDILCNVRHSTHKAPQNNQNLSIIVIHRSLSALSLSLLLLSPRYIFLPNTH